MVKFCATELQSFVIFDFDHRKSKIKYHYVCIVNFTKESFCSFKVCNVESYINAQKSSSLVCVKTFKLNT